MEEKKIVVVDEKDVETEVKLYAVGLLTSKYVFELVGKENDAETEVKLYAVDLLMSEYVFE